MNERKYYYSKLSEEEKSICDIVISAIHNYERQVVFDSPVQSETFTNIFDVVQRDFPEIFYVDINHTTMYTKGPKSTILVEYLYPQNTIMQYQKRVKTVVDSIITPELMKKTKAERELYIYDMLVRNVTYATHMSVRENYNIIGPLVKKIGVCQGYSRTFQLLCEKAGILCLSVHGSSTQPQSTVDVSHAWNMVQLSETERYQVDATWDSCIYHAGLPDFHTYYNISDSQMAKDHYWDRSEVPKTIIP